MEYYFIGSLLLVVIIGLISIPIIKRSVRERKA